ncbi:hypothetical protein TNCV_2492701 [Trichonephila clavipes]|uniref:Uncharacterized protein n=1 Tax=Trichonephila clavipes TaxID=2585209 RepID=A0A8X6V4L0_TRICX|nr:hypothetical protein TNCV_2492701 [Trichonephila clavipes]
MPPLKFAAPGRGSVCPTLMQPLVGKARMISGKGNGINPTAPTPEFPLCQDRGATALRGQKPTVPNSVFITLGTEVQEQMFRSGGQSYVKPPVFSSQAS